MFKPGKRHKSARLVVGSRAALLSCLLVPWSLLCGGCGFWEEFRANDYHIKAVISPPDPLVVLNSGTASPDQGAKALGRLREPLQNKGNERDQEYVLTLLAKAAKEDQQAWCRQNAIKSLSTFKDPRAATAIVEAYYAAENFSPDTRCVIRQLALAAAGNFADRSQQAVDLLVRVIQSPPIENSKGSEEEKQMYLDERLAAARSLEHSKNYRATEALVQVLRTEKDVALRDCAHKSLVAATGKKLPPDAKAWDELLNNPEPPRGVAQEEKARIGQPILRTSATEQK